MRPEIVAAERAKEVRDAARAWRRAGLVREEVLSRTVSLYPDDRQRFGPGFRALAFMFAGIAALAMIGLSFVLYEPRLDGRGAFLFWGLALAGLTEFQRGPLKRTDAGAETATALLAVLFAVIGSVISPVGRSSDEEAIRFLAASCAICVVAAWRWGDSPFFLGAGLSGFGLLAQTDHGRLLWIGASLLAIPTCLDAARRKQVAPSHRTGTVIVGAVSILALYAAIHVWSWDKQVIESMHTLIGFRPDAAAASPLRPASILATALLPPALFLLGWHRREPLLLYAGLILIGASIATIRLYRAVMPLSFALVLIGAVCLALALSVRKWLRSGDKGERDGFTADPLFDNTNRTDAIRSVVAMASFTPAAQAAPVRSGFEGGGGSFGGGGATGSF